MPNVRRQRPSDIPVIHWTGGVKNLGTPVGSDIFVKAQVDCFSEKLEACLKRLSHLADVLFCSCVHPGLPWQNRYDRRQCRYNLDKLLLLRCRQATPLRREKLQRPSCTRISVLAELGVSCLCGRNGRGLGGGGGKRPFALWEPWFTTRASKEIRSQLAVLAAFSEGAFYKAAKLLSDNSSSSDNPLSPLGAVHPKVQFSEVLRTAILR